MDSFIGLIPYILFLNHLTHNYPEKCEGWYFNGWSFKTICGKENSCVFFSVVNAPSYWCIWSGK